MTLEQYRSRQIQRALALPQHRNRCLVCRRPAVTCYCAQLQPFPSALQFVILIHPEEVTRAIATGRMAHLSLANSLLLEGIDFTADDRVNALLSDARYHPVVLYPGESSVNLSALHPEHRQAFFSPGKKPLVFVLDATWAKAKKMKRLSRNLHSLPLVSFTPPRLSGFRRVRRQPHPHCFSTIESIHLVIELMGGSPAGEHEKMLELFTQMVDTQTAFHEKGGGRPSRGLKSKSRPEHNAGAVDPVVSDRPLVL